MNAIFFSDYSNLAIYINNKLNSLGIKTCLLTSNTRKHANNSTLVQLKHTPIRKLDYMLNSLRSFYYRYLYLNVENKYAYYQDIDEDSNYFDFTYVKSKINIKPDYIFILFDYRVLTTNSIKEIYDYYKVPIIWLLVDMKPMTGGCSYAFNCLKYQTSCEQCPAISSGKHNSFAHNTIEKKQRNLNNVDLRLITFSTEQNTQARKSAVFSKFKVHNFFFPIDKDIFNVQDMHQSREKLNLDLDKKIILIGALAFKEERKGFKYLKEALSVLAKQDCSNILLLVVGDVSDKEFEAIQIQKKVLGKVSMNTLAIAYQASNVFVCASIADSGPTMVNQSIMCGTPVVAFNAGVCADIVISKETGMLVDVGDSEELHRGIEYILNLEEEKYVAMRKSCYNMSNEMNDRGFLNNLAKILDN